MAGKKEKLEWEARGQQEQEEEGEGEEGEGKRCQNPGRERRRMSDTRWLCAYFSLAMAPTNNPPRSRTTTDQTAGKLNY